MDAEDNNALVKQNCRLTQELALRCLYKLASVTTPVRTNLVSTMYVLRSNNYGCFVDLRSQMHNYLCLHNSLYTWLTQQHSP